MSILEPYAVKDVPWSTMNPRDKGPRWVVVAVDNVAAGWSDISSEPNMEAYISLYVFDSWKVYYACSTEKLFQLYDCGNYAWCKDDTPEDERDRICNAWEIGVEPGWPMVLVRDVEEGRWGTVVHMYPDDGDCPDDDWEEYNKYVEGMIEHVVCNPPLLDTTAKAARVHDPTCLLRHHGAKENAMAKKSRLICRCCGSSNIRKVSDLDICRSLRGWHDQNFPVTSIKLDCGRMYTGPSAVPVWAADPETGVPRYWPIHELLALVSKSIRDGMIHFPDSWGQDPIPVAEEKDEH